jgi:anti-anti-sigma factor
MRLSKVENGSELVSLKCEGQVSSNEFEPGSDPLEKAVGPGCFTRRVIINLEKTSYLDSSGISWLIVSHKHFVRGGGLLVLHSVPPMVDHVFQLLKLPLVLNIAPNEGAARALALGDGK